MCCCKSILHKNRFKCKFETSNNFVKSCEQVNIEINKARFITKISFTAQKINTVSPFDSLLRIHNKIVTLLDSWNAHATI